MVTCAKFIRRERTIIMLNVLQRLSFFDYFEHILMMTIRGIIFFIIFLIIFKLNSHAILDSCSFLLQLEIIEQKNK